MKMEARILWISFLVTFQFYNVECKNNFFEYYYSRHHRGHSTTETVLSSTSDISSEDESELSSSDYTSRRADSYSTTEHISRRKTTDSYSTTEEDNSLENLKYEPTGGRHRFHHLFIARIGLVVGSIVAFLGIIGVIVCCCPKCCRGSEHRGYTRRNDLETATEVLPQEPIFVPYPRHQVIVQQFEYPQGHFPPAYQPQRMQQHPRGSLEQNFYNLPEAPPPYDSHLN